MTHGDQSLRPLRSPEVSPEWMTEALASRFPGAVVAECRELDVTHGSTSRMRVGLSYRAGTGPPSVFLKLPFKHRRTLAALGVLRPEPWVGVHRDELPIETPDVFAAAGERFRYTVVFEDLTLRPGMTTLTGDSTIAIETVADGLQQLARMHAKFWNSEALAASAGLTSNRSWASNPMTLTVTRIGCARGARRWRKEGREGLPSGRTQLRGFRRFLRWPSESPVTLVHGDLHLGNTYHDAETPIGFLDWQVARFGPWEHDVGYFLVSALDPEDRRAHERWLLHDYLTTLRSEGADAPSDDDAWNCYRRTPAYGLPTWLATLGLGTYQEDVVGLELVRRFSEAHRDLETEDALR